MAIQPTNWQPFASDEERLNYLKEHKLAPQGAKAPKALFYSGVFAEGTEPCTAEGTADSCTLVIQVGERYHCIHPDCLAEMQKGAGRGRERTKAARERKAPAKATGPDFVAIDFETATSSYESACALGIAVVRDGRVAETWYHLLQPPQNRYEEANVRVHGITPSQTADAPTLDQIWPEIRHFFDGTLVVAHNARFDTSVLRSSLRQSDGIPNFKFADTVQMVRNIVPGRHTLDACCAYFDIPLEHHHNALDDAVACANVALCCVRSVGCESLRVFLKQEGFPQTDFHRRNNFNRFQRKSVRLGDVHATVDQFDLTHPLYQKTLVFTGDLSIDRSEAVQLAVNKGAVVKSGVSGKTQIVVLGRRENGAAMSSKEKKARELIAAGKELRLLNEEEFLALVRG